MINIHGCISNYDDLDNAAGDLITDMRGDRDYPKTVSNKRVIINYLQRRGACKEALDTFNQVWRHYKAEMLNVSKC